MSSVKNILDKVKWPFIYVSAFSILTGAGNAVGEVMSQNAETLEEITGSFIQGGIRSFPLNACVNTVYPKIVSKITKESKNPRLYANVAATLLQPVVYLLLRYVANVDDPLMSTLMGTPLGYTLTNIQVSKEKNKKSVELESLAYSTNV
jgi:hypothetical protein|tara:strand:- start:933 stop:1379 length:447 start_codon:yes stop_codon:yes gene_type:complete